MGRILVNVALKKVADSMRQAAGLQPTPANTTPAVAPAPSGAAAPKPQAPEPKAKSPTAAPQRRAEVPAVGERPRP